MSRLTAWIGSTQATDTADSIADKPTSITVTRGASTLSAQTVRLETLSSQKQVQGAGGQTYLIDALALGYKGHPSIADTNLQAFDRFKVDGVSYVVIIIMPAHQYCVQAYLEVRA